MPQEKANKNFFVLVFFAFLLEYQISPWINGLLFYFTFPFFRPTHSWNFQIFSKRPCQNPNVRNY